MQTKTLMIQGTCSEAGKSIMVAGLCRWLVRRGYRVAPFKPQNISNNGAITEDRGEIGRSQAVQAMACEVAPQTDMNPVFVKPLSDDTVQVIVQGKVQETMAVDTFHRFRQIARQAVEESFERLRSKYDVVIIEGSGSPAEIHLRQDDIANMGFARRYDCPVILVGDMQRGGIFAQFVGTLEWLDDEDRKLLKGFVVNRHRGDPQRLHEGLHRLEDRTGRPVFGIMPYIHDLQLEEEDALPVEIEHKPKHIAKLNIVVPSLPNINNNTDFDPLRKHANIKLYFIEHGSHIPRADLIILPGSNNVRADLAWLRQQNWGEVLARHLRYNGKVIGIGGGFQMLGQWIHDPDGLEGTPGDTPGFGWLKMQTTLGKEKYIDRVEGRLEIDGVKFQGFASYQGRPDGDALLRPVLRFGDQHDGAISDDNQILGTMFHGVFEIAEASHALLRWGGLVTSKQLDYAGFREQELDRLADVIDLQIDTKKLLKAMKLV